MALEDFLYKSIGFFGKFLAFLIIDWLLRLIVHLDGFEEDYILRYVVILCWNIRKYEKRDDHKKIRWFKII